jgi:hypothetical protein
MYFTKQFHCLAFLHNLSSSGVKRYMLNHIYKSFSVARGQKRTYVGMYIDKQTEAASFARKVFVTLVVLLPAV